MRLLRSVHSLITLCHRLRDPQVQVWVMAGFSVLLVIIGHLRAWSLGSEGKNTAGVSPSRLLVAGARVNWTEEFGSYPRETQRPQLVLSGPTAGMAAVPAKKSPPRLDLRPAMQEAASRPWQFLDRPLRQQLAATAKSSGSPRIHLAWSGDARGNAALIALQQSLRERPEPAGFVIGNGSRSGDGRIEYLPSHGTAVESLNITLIGQSGPPTPNQMAALGELLHQLEALSGHLLLPETAMAEHLSVLALQSTGRP